MTSLLLRHPKIYVQVVGSPISDKSSACRAVQRGYVIIPKDVGQILGQVGQVEIPIQAFYSCPFVFGFFFDRRKGATYLGILQLSYIYRYVQLEWKSPSWREKVENRRGPPF